MKKIMMIIALGTVTASTAFANTSQQALNQLHNQIVSVQKTQSADLDRLEAMLTKNSSATTQRIEAEIKKLQMDTNAKINALQVRMDTLEKNTQAQHQQLYQQLQAVNSHLQKEIQGVENGKN